MSDDQLREPDEVPTMVDVTPRVGTPGEIRWFGAVAAIAQLALMAIGAWSLWTMGGGWWMGAIGALVWVAAHAMVFLVLVAPGSTLRLAFRERLLVNLLLGSVVLVASGFSGLWLPALVALSTIILCDALDQRRSRVPVADL